MDYFLFLIRLFYILIISIGFSGLIFESIHVTIFPYGKLNASNKFNARNPLEKFIRNLSVPKYWFYQFYIVGTIWVTLIIIDVVVFRSGYLSWFVGLIEGARDSKDTIYSDSYTKQPAEQCIVGLFMLLFQTVRRAYECLFIDRPSLKARMHIGHYVLGLAFYIVTSLAIFVEGFGNLDVYGGDKLSPSFPPISNFLTWNFFIAISLFLYASYHQHVVHKILASLRPKYYNVSSQSRPIYVIPKGDWFDYISSAHYFAEILIYISFVVLNKGQIFTSYLVVAWVAFCLGIVARDSDSWGKERFGEKWPSNRWKIFPGVY
ncbi:17578_t:CDS:2 [Acaulospora morrowiae]|uniref:17578_t:CDS:1 n=1 Tax=Acaulospora morrowiae TaxID=94023 RepID=A0A9N8ZIA3_9GLOM|nr:17578_t:CDS:2 [Acaulospora morrowiae]